MFAKKTSNTFGDENNKHASTAACRQDLQFQPHDTVSSFSIIFTVFGVIYVCLSWNTINEVNNTFFKGRRRAGAVGVKTKRKHHLETVWRTRTPPAPRVGSAAPVRWLRVLSIVGSSLAVGSISELIRWRLSPANQGLRYHFQLDSELLEEVVKTSFMPPAEPPPRTVTSPAD